MKTEILIAAELRFYSHFVEDENIQRVMSKASEALESLALEAAKAAPVQPRTNVPAVLPKSNWIAFLERLPTRPRNLLSKRYGLSVPSLEEWAKGISMKSLMSIHNMGSTSAKAILSEMEKSGLAFVGGGIDGSR